MPGKKKIIVEHLGLIGYQEGLAIQEAYHKKIVDHKCDHFTMDDSFESTSPSYLLFCQHHPVYTLGSNGCVNHLLTNKTVLDKQAIQFYHVNRGGDITYHGPGQLILYPIIDLENFVKDIHIYLRLLESSVIDTLAHFNIISTRFPGLTGVWLEGDKRKKQLDRKICAIGIRVSRWVTMHGLALNVCNDLWPFTQIIPCGISKAVTSMEQELKKCISIMAVSDILEQNIINKLNYV